MTPTPAHPRASGLRRLRQFLAQATLLLVGVVGVSADGLTWPQLKQEIRLKFPTVTQLSTDSLAARLARPGTVWPFLLDVRAPEEYQISHLQGARLTPDLERALEILAEVSADTPIVAYCSARPK